MTLEDLVPSPELCSRIPEADFKDTYAVYVKTVVNMDTVVLGTWVEEPFTVYSSPMSRAKAFANMDYLEAGISHVLIPAPTLQEILKQLTVCDLVGNIDTNEKKFANCIVGLPEFYAKHLLASQCTEPIPLDAETALTLWLKLKGGLK